MENGYKKIADGYLYKIADGTLVEYPGEVIVHERRNKMMSSSRRGRALFCVSNEVRSSYKNLTVCINEGEVYNGMVWLKESNMGLGASKLFIHNVFEIEELERKITRHQKNIDILREVQTDES